MYLVGTHAIACAGMQACPSAKAQLNVHGEQTTKAIIMLGNVHIGDRAALQRCPRPLVTHWNCWRDRPASPLLFRARTRAR